jgi:hypothetical protein
LQKHPDCDATRTLSLLISGNLFGLLDLWARQLDAGADICNIKESFFIKGELQVEEGLTVDGHVEGRIDLGGLPTFCAR